MYMYIHIWSNKNNYVINQVFYFSFVKYRNKCIHDILVVNLLTYSICN